MHRDENDPVQGYLPTHHTPEEERPDSPASDGPPAAAPSVPPPPSIDSSDAARIKPRTPRRERGPRELKGLPEDTVLAELARSYLSLQRSLWPALVERELIPSPEESTVVTSMVDDFKQRHGGGEVTNPSQALLRSAKLLAATYSRFSCDNSNTRSIVDQLHNELTKAHAEGRFVPWAYVFADYSVSGLCASRQGYQSLKCLLKERRDGLDAVYIDDFTRASRDELEWWRLAALLKRIGLRLVGASDGFDTSRPESDMQMSVYVLLSKMFMKSLREKVRRGMQGAARRGTATGRPPLGYTLRQRVDAGGRPEFNSDGTPVHEFCIDPTSRQHVEMAYDLYCDKRWSLTRIARRFNEVRVDGGNGWTAGSIRKLLYNPAYVGIWIYNRSHQERDPETGTISVVKHPYTQWIVRVLPHTRLIPEETWKLARRRLYQVRCASPTTGRKFSRNQHSATTLFSGTLICGYCGKEIMLTRSAGKYKSFGCIHGSKGSQGCALDSHKSVPIVEKALLGYLTEQVFTARNLELLVEEANRFLAQEAARPRANVGPLKAEMSTLEKKIQRFLRLIEDEPEEDNCRAHHARIRELETRRRELSVQIRDVESSNQTPPPPLTLEEITSYLEDLRGLLNLEIPAAAAALRAVTGPITITHERVGHKKRGGARWIATFTPNLMPTLAAMAQMRNDPDSVTLEYLNHRKWIMHSPVFVNIEGRAIPKYVQHAAMVLELVEKRGLSRNAAARELGLYGAQVHAALRHAREGVASPYGRAARAAKPPRMPKYRQVMADVVRLRHTEGRSFRWIARQLGINPPMAELAYRKYKEEILAAGGEVPPRPQGRLGHAVRSQIRSLRATGLNITEIARAIGCSAGAVYGELRRSDPQDESA